MEEINKFVLDVIKDLMGVFVKMFLGNLYV